MFGSEICCLLRSRSQVTTTSKRPVIKVMFSLWSRTRPKWLAAVTNRLSPIGSYYRSVGLPPPPAKHLPMTITCPFSERLWRRAVAPLPAQSPVRVRAFPHPRPPPRDAYVTVQLTVQYGRSRYVHVASHIRLLSRNSDVTYIHNLNLNICFSSP